MQVRAYGISNLNIATINLVSVRRGGRDTAYNKYKQPLQLDIALNVSTLCSGFASMESGNDFTIEDSLKSFDTSPALSSGITTVGNIIKSLAPAPTEAVNKFNNTSNESDLNKIANSNSLINLASNINNTGTTPNQQANNNPPGDTNNSPIGILSKTNDEFNNSGDVYNEIDNNSYLT